MGGRHYLVIQYTDRETREDSYEQFFYLRRDNNGAYVADDKLNAAQPPADEGGGKKAPALRAADGVRLAKAAHMRQAVAGLEWPAWSGCRATSSPTSAARSAS
jgi:hypothetical protein